MQTAMQERARDDVWDGSAEVERFCTAVIDWIALPDRNAAALERASDSHCAFAHARGARAEEIMVAIKWHYHRMARGARTPSYGSSDMSRRYVQAIDGLLTRFFADR